MVWRDGRSGGAHKSRCDLRIEIIKVHSMSNGQHELPTQLKLTHEELLLVGVILPKPLRALKALNPASCA